MRNLPAIIPLAFLLACDADGVEALAFREQGPPSASYISTWNGQPIHAAEFAEAVLTCSKVGDPPWLLTLSDYDPDVAVTDNRVVGLSGSIMASDELYQCLLKVWAGNDPVELP